MTPALMSGPRLDDPGMDSGTLANGDHQSSGAPVLLATPE